jgi:hypothetical protein
MVVQTVQACRLDICFMTYELAKELKDAGFPQEGDGGFCLDNDCKDDRKTCTCIAYQPTLSELIEACGDEFLALRHAPSRYRGDPESRPMDWQACGGEFRATHWSYQQSGYTPEEATARLWLALNQKV